MGDGHESVADAAFRELGRIWDWLFWRVLFGFAVLWDLLVGLDLLPQSLLNAFGGGLATGLTFAGVLFTARRPR